jgi:hypothetical protein
MLYISYHYGLYWLLHSLLSMTYYSQGRNTSLALEDEMYMSSIWMLAENLNCKWYDIPLDAWKTTLHLEYGVCYPFTSYLKTTTADVSIASAVACIFMNPSRRSVMLWVLGKQSARDYDEGTSAELESRGWIPDVHMLQEFTVTNLTGDKVTKCDSMDSIIDKIYHMGFGPCPFFRRSGVLINTCRDEMDQGNDDSRRLGCIVPHTLNVHGCCHSRYRKCYFCPQNPFYEVSFGVDEAKVRVQALRASLDVVPVGTQLLLSIDSPHLLSMVNCESMRIGGNPQRKRRRCKYDQSGVPMRVVSLQSENIDPEATNVFEYISVKLDICRNFAAYDGMIYVTLAVTYKNSSTAIDTKGLYVRACDLKIPLRREIEQAMSKIVMD